MAELTHYQILGVARTATEEEIRSAYRRTARASHTDVAGADASLFIAATEARDVLLDPQRRAAYDEVLRLDDLMGRAHAANARPGTNRAHGDDDGAGGASDAASATWDYLRDQQAREEQVEDYLRRMRQAGHARTPAAPPRAPGLIVRYFRSRNWRLVVFAVLAGFVASALHQVPIHLGIWVWITYVAVQAISLLWWIAILAPPKITKRFDLLMESLMTAARRHAPWSAKSRKESVHSGENAGR